MLNKKLKAWVDEKPDDRRVTVEHGRGQNTFCCAQTFEHGDLCTSLITNLDDITGQILANKEAKELKELERLQAKYPDAPEAA